MTSPPAPHRFDLSAGNLSLDFVNTVGDRPRRREEHLAGWPDLLAWGEQAGLLSKREAHALYRTGRARSQAMARAFAGALTLRERLYRIFEAIAAGRPPAAEDLDAVNAALRRAMAELVVEPRADGFVWGWRKRAPSVDRLLYPVLRAAADLMVSSERASVRECASETCSWLFVDRSRTHKRRWCSMQTCGNRNKVRRFYERRRAGR